MRAIRILDQVPEFVDTELDAGPLPDDSLVVDVVSASICSSDLHLIDLSFAEGAVLGHEVAGVAPDGTPVAIEPVVSCGHCSLCTDGQRQHCGGRELLGIGGASGGMAEQVMVAPSCLVPLPDGVDPRNAAVIEPLAVGVRAADRCLAATSAGSDPVLVIGAGSIGLCAAAALVERGAQVEVVARHQHQAEAAERLGAKAILSPADSDPGALAGEIDPRWVVLDSVASAGSVAQGLTLVRPSGRIVLAGTIWDGLELGLDWWTKEVELVPSAFYGGQAPDREIDRAARLLAERPEIAELLLTHRFPLEAATEGFETARARSEGTIKVVFHP